MTTLAFLIGLLIGGGLVAVGTWQADRRQPVTTKPVTLPVLVALPRRIRIR